MSELVNNNNPSILFKYRDDSENTEKIITDHKVWLSTADKLNDPLECRTGVVPLKLKNEIISQMEGGQLLGLMGMPFSSPSDTLYSLTPKQTRQWRKRIKKLPHKRRVKALRLLHDQHGIQLSNPKKTFEVFEEQLRQVGIFSLSETADNELMWAHYANSHEGIALGFERNSGNLLGNDVHTIPVEYKLDKPTFSGGASTVASISKQDNGALQSHVSFSLEDPTLRSSISTKTPSWDYEKEWRYVELSSGLFDFPGKLVKIVFGVNLSEERRNHYRKLVKLSGHSCQEAEMIIDDNSKLRLIDLK